MKKIFPFTSETHKPERVVEQIKSDVRKYLKRERRKALPEGADYWDFNCKVGKDESSAASKHVEEIIPAVDQVSASGAGSVYIEILATPGHRKGKAAD